MYWTLEHNPVVPFSKWSHSVQASVWNAAAAAKSLQSCLTLCDPIDGSPPGSAFPGILQARTLEDPGNNHQHSTWERPYHQDCDPYVCFSLKRTRISWTSGWFQVRGRKCVRWGHVPGSCEDVESHLVKLPVVKDGSTGTSIITTAINWNTNMFKSMNL